MQNIGVYLAEAPGCEYKVKYRFKIDPRRCKASMSTYLKLPNVNIKLLAV
jgi:hypothetical protein